MQINWRDAASGLIFICIGAFVALVTFFTLQIGTAFRMGPGYFPLVLGILLIVLGLIIVLTSIGRASEHIGGIGWRGLFFVLLPPIFFGLTVRGLGVAPAIAIVVAVSSLASKKTKPVSGLLLALFMSAFCTIVFVKLIGLPLPVLGHWIL